jgi:hypothetical protein
MVFPKLFCSLPQWHSIWKGQFAAQTYTPQWISNEYHISIIISFHICTLCDSMICWFWSYSAENECLIVNVCNADIIGWYLLWQICLVYLPSELWKDTLPDRSFSVVFLHVLLRYVRSIWNMGEGRTSLTWNNEMDWNLQSPRGR